MTHVIETHGSFVILRCASCGLQFADPMKANTDNYALAYDRGGQAPAEVAGEGLPYLGWTEQASPNLDEFGVFLTAAQQFALRKARNRVPKGSPGVDIGFGAGWFLGAMKSIGLRPYGLEVAQSPIRILGQKGYTVGNHRIESLPDNWPKPALITAFEVVEHLEDPIGFLRKINSSHPKADLFLSVPDERRWFLLGGREAHDYRPNHMTRWSPVAMKLALDKAGYRYSRVWRIHATAQEISMASVRRFLRLSKNKVVNQQEHSHTTLRQELKKRAIRRWLAMPAAGVLPVCGFTACSMVAIASSRPI